MGALSGGRSRILTVPACAKLNLGLEVLSLRQDGDHELRTLFQTIELADTLQLTLTSGECRLSCDHPGVPVDETNLALRAALELKRRAGVRAGVHIRLDKRVPVAGGLGGGSSDAAAALIGLDALWGTGLGTSGLLPLARRLGADVPFFLFGGTALGLARGDEIYPLAYQLRLHVVVVDPARPLSTAAVFRRADARLTPRENSNTIFRFLARYGENGTAAVSLLSNDLEVAALEEAPELEDAFTRIRTALVEEGARMTSLSGSGSAYFGVFDGAARAAAAARRLEAGGFRALPSRMLTADGYRRLWQRAIGRRRTERAG